MSKLPPSDPRHIGLLGATGIGVGAIVGGGILALAGVAFAVTGPGALVAFALNGFIALLTALTFAEMATSFPESGGTYTFAKKVLSVETAFMVGWVVWFASIMAAVLYALGFGTFAAIVLEAVWGQVAGAPPTWIRGGECVTLLALGATAFYTWGLARRPGGGGQWETVGKVVVFAVLIAGGLWALPSLPEGAIRQRLDPFFSGGGMGLLQAMGYTFIALQGFDLIAAVAGEVKEPRRNLPRAMVASLVLALLIYLPLLFLISTVGVPDGTDIAAMASADPEAVVAVAAEAYLGRTGFWLVILAAVLAMASALQANLLASSHIALVMARDRNLPARLRQLDEARGTPVAAVLLTSATVVVAVLAIPDVAAAGAASSLIFLISFALAHWTNILARRRGGGRSESLRLPLFPLVPAVGGLACLALALFQGLSVPAAGGIALAWLAAGGGLYYAIFSRRAQVADAAAEALDPTLVRLRGRSPLVLVPIANPASAESMVMVANALAPAQVGRVLLLSVVRTPETWRPDQVPPQLAYAQQVLGESLTTAFAAELSPEALVTVAKDPWRDIRRVAQTYRCESLLLGLGDLQADDAGNDNGDEDGLDPEALGANLEWLMREVASDVVLLRAPDGWRPSTVRRVLVPVGGRRDQSSLRARLLGSLLRTQDLEVRYLGISLPGADADHEAWLEREIQLLADDEASGRHEVKVVRRDSVVDAVVEHAADVDLVVLGLSRQRHRRVFGRIPAGVIRGSQTAVLMIRQRA